MNSIHTNHHMISVDTPHASHDCLSTECVFLNKDWNKLFLFVTFHLVQYSAPLEDSTSYASHLFYSPVADWRPLYSLLTDAANYRGCVRVCVRYIKSKHIHLPRSHDTQL